MGQKLSPKEAELYRRCDEVLHYLWDSIGVASASGASDEYQAYLPQVFSLVQGGANHHEIAEHLNNIVADSMSLTPNKENVLEVARTLLDWHKWIHEGAT
jgi:hypothetical protein